MNRAQRWAAELESWALPKELLDQAVDDPWALPVELFSCNANDVTGETPSSARANEALHGGGSVLDVGCGGGGASLRLQPKPDFVTGVDEREGMLAAFDALAQDVGIPHATVWGRWPNVASTVEPADVVVCHHVLYNVQDIAEFVTALDEHARKRVVIELTDEHPRAWSNPFFDHFHKLARPSGPTANDAVAIVRDVGIEVRIEEWSEPPLFARHAELLVPFLRRSLCLRPEREPEVAALLERFPPPSKKRVVTMWWDARQSA